MRTPSYRCNIYEQERYKLILTFKTNFTVTNLRQINAGLNTIFSHEYQEQQNKEITNASEVISFK